MLRSPGTSFSGCDFDLFNYLAQIAFEGEPTALKTFPYQQDQLIGDH